MSRASTFLLILILLCGIDGSAYCDEILLKNGNSVKGIIVKESEGSLTLEIMIGTLTFREAEIESVNRATEEENAILKEEWARTRTEREKRYKHKKEGTAEVDKEKEAVDAVIDLGKRPSGDEKAAAKEPWYDFSSPEATFETYMNACNDLDFEKSDMCYTEEFRIFTKADTEYMAHRNKGQLRTTYRAWHGKPYKLEMHGNKAIMRFSPEFKRPEPIYFVKVNGEWKIDAMFSFNNVIMVLADGWFWRNPNINNEKAWLSR